MFAKIGNTDKKKAQSKIKLQINKSDTTFSLILVYIVICVIFSILSPYFFTIKNLLNIGLFASFIGVMAAGVTVAMLFGAIDISQYAVATLSGLFGGLLLNAGFGTLWTIILCLGVGAICGAINGTLVAYLKISGIIATLGTMQIFRGAAYLITKGLTIEITDKKFALIGKGYIFKIIPIAIIIMVVLFLIIFYILKYTSFGRKIFAVGGNEQASFLSGINVNLTKFGGLVICGACSALAGLILASQVGAAVPSSGVGSEMGVLSAVILGGVSLSGGKGRISGTVIGVLILATIQNGLTLLSVQSYYQMIINGLVLILAVLMDIVRSGAFKKK